MIYSLLIKFRLIMEISLHALFDQIMLVSSQLYLFRVYACCRFRMWQMFPQKGTHIENTISLLRLLLPPPLLLLLLYHTRH